MLIAKLLMDLIKILNEKTSPKAIAGGVALGSIIGLTPKGSLHNLAIVFLLFILNVNGSAAAVATALFALFSYLGDPLFNKIGYALLTARPLQGLWTALYNAPTVPWTRFNNTLVLGSLLFALALFAPLFLLVDRAVPLYRERYQQKVTAHMEKWKVVHVFKASKLYGLYQKFS